MLKTYVIKNGGPPLIGRNGLNSLKLGICKIKYLNKTPKYQTSIPQL